MSSGSRWQSLRAEIARSRTGRCQSLASGRRYRAYAARLRQRLHERRALAHSSRPCGQCALRDVRSPSGVSVLRYPPDRRLSTTQIRTASGDGLLPADHSRGAMLSSATTLRPVIVRVRLAHRSSCGREPLRSPRPDWRRHILLRRDRSGAALGASLPKALPGLRAGTEVVADAVHRSMRVIWRSLIKLCERPCIEARCGLRIGLKRSRWVVRAPYDVPGSWSGLAFRLASRRSTKKSGRVRWPPLQVLLLPWCARLAAYLGSPSHRRGNARQPIGLYVLIRRARTRVDRCDRPSPIEGAHR